MFQRADKKALRGMQCNIQCTNCVSKCKSVDDYDECQVWLFRPCRCLTWHQPLYNCIGKKSLPDTLWLTRSFMSSYLWSLLLYREYAHCSLMYDFTKLTCCNVSGEAYPAQTQKSLSPCLHSPSFTAPSHPNAVHQKLRQAISPMQARRRGSKALHSHPTPFLCASNAHRKDTECP
jgi:hypothetical protein